MSVKLSWFHLPEPKVQWLVDGLFTADGHAAIIGKPKAGKSTFLRNLIVAVVRGDRKFLDRSIDLAPGTGRVLYCHFDRKDSLWRVARELRKLGATEDDAERLVLRTPSDIKTAKTFEERLEWLKKEVIALAPHLVVIDLLWQFAVVKNSNDFNAVLDAINTLQDALHEAGYQGALIVTIHGRKAESATDAFDDMLGSTAQRASFGTLIMCKQYKNDGLHSISSDQTDRDDAYGEIPETVISRNADGTLKLGQSLRDVARKRQETKFESDLVAFVNYITSNPGAEMDKLTSELGMSKKYILKLFTEASAFVRREGEGIKGDSFKYFPKEEGGEK